MKTCPLLIKDSKTMDSSNSIIRLSDRTHGNALFTSTMSQVRACLLSYGFVLLPSDTCYSIAALASNNRVFDTINTLLNRPKDPISLAFQNLPQVERFAELNPISAVLLETLTPGPLTVVCKARPEVPIELTAEIVGSTDRTIGVRIPDNNIERDIAACTRYPITTVAIRDPKDNKPVKNFNRAINIVSESIKNLETAFWGFSIEGDEFCANISTVVRVASDGEKIKLLRQGDIPFEDIKTLANNIPFWSIEDWT
jgi:L-threonylcarbamoyladenylate synthase